MNATAASSNIHRPGCATREVLDRIADKWATLILGVLAGGPRRFGEIARAADAMNPRVLSRTLRHLERDGLIHRELLSAQPPAVRYSLTDMGSTLDDILIPLRMWAERNIGDIHQARTRFDETADSLDRTPWQH